MDLEFSPHRCGHDDRILPLLVYTSYELEKNTELK